MGGSRAIWSQRACCRRDKCTRYARLPKSSRVVRSAASGCERSLSIHREPHCQANNIAIQLQKRKDGLLKCHVFTTTEHLNFRLSKLLAQFVNLPQRGIPVHTPLRQNKLYGLGTKCPTLQLTVNDVPSSYLDCSEKIFVAFSDAMTSPNKIFGLFRQEKILSTTRGVGTAVTW